MRNWYGSETLEPSADNAPRILILEPDIKVRSSLLRYAIKGWQGAALGTDQEITIVMDDDKLIFANFK